MVSLSSAEQMWKYKYILIIDQFPYILQYAPYIITLFCLYLCTLQIVLYRDNYNLNNTFAIKYLYFFTVHVMHTFSMHIFQHFISAMIPT